MKNFDIWICEHCSCEIKNKNKDNAWSRKGFHFCSRSCYYEDKSNLDEWAVLRIEKSYYSKMR